MHLKYRNVNSAFHGLVKGIHTGHIPTVKTGTRNGNVLQIEEPVLITYSKPRERVLINKARRANPFFHLFESLWMLCGRNDVAALAVYNSKINDYSDDGKTFNGAYGYRWRHADYPSTGYHDGGADDPTAVMKTTKLINVDQLDILVNHLKTQPTSRRAVLQMWNVEDDLLKIEAHPERSGNLYNPDIPLTPSKDVACNLSIMFSLRNTVTQGCIKDYCLGTDSRWGRCPNCGSIWSEQLQSRVIQNLDMTITNRSNDCIWGCLGANYVHFSILQEYMAARIGAEVGLYHHFTNNLHVYKWNWKPDEWLQGCDYDDGCVNWEDNYSASHCVPLIQDPKVFEQEMVDFVKLFDGSESPLTNQVVFKEPFLQLTAHPMLMAFHMHKAKEHTDAKITAQLVQDDAWRRASLDWLEGGSKHGNSKETK